MKILEEYPCENSKQQRMREQYWIEQLNPELNMVNAYTTDEYKIEYNKERGKVYYYETIEYQSQRKADFYQQNKEQIDERNSVYYEKNKETIALERKKKRDVSKTTCECGSVYTYITKSKHLKTKKHIDWQSL
jgi:hypothetical protein